MGEYATPGAKKAGKDSDDGFGNSEKLGQFDRMDDIVAKAQASIRKVVNSPFAPKANDSLDAMRLEFLADYNRIMRESDENYGQDLLNKSPAKTEHEFSALKQSRTEAKPTKGGALSEMVAAGALLKREEERKDQATDDAKKLLIENEQLKAMIQIMKVEREAVMKQANSTKAPQGPLI